jgi:DNA helicase HerA-like ATPase
MPEQPNTLIGHVIDIQGSILTASLIEDEQGSVPKVTIGDEDILVGQIGSYVSVTQGSIKILALITRMTEQEKLTPLAQGDTSADSIRLSYAQRIVNLVPIGSVKEDGIFERGVSTYPTTGAEVHAVDSSDIDTMFSKFRSKGYDVGNLSSHPTLTVCLDPTSLFGRHFAILGQTGAGKSWAVANLVQKAVVIMPKAHIIILDIHGEYCWTDDNGNRLSAFTDDKFRYIDARQLEIPYWLMTFSELCDLLIEHSEREATNQTAFFRDCLLAGRQTENETAQPPLGLERVTVDTPIYFSLDDILVKVRAKNIERVGNRQGPMFGDFDRFLMRLESKLNDERYDFLLKPKIRTSSNTLAPMLRDFVGLGESTRPETKRPITVIDLSSVPFDVRPTVAAQIGRLAFEFNYWNPQYRDFPILLICEESHVYIPRESESQYAGSRKSMERIAKEGRKYGVGLGIVSQRPHEVSETVLSQCGTFLCLRITNPNDQTYVRNLVPEAERDLVEILAGLGRGQAMVLGEAVPLPTRLQFYKPNPPPNSDDIDFYTKWKEGPEDINVDEIVNRWRRQER